MDLSFIQEQLKTFDTFASNIGDFLQLPVKLIDSIVDWFNGDEAGLIDGENSGADINEDWATTEGARFHQLR